MILIILPLTLAVKSKVWSKKYNIFLWNVKLQHLSKCTWLYSAAVHAQLIDAVSSIVAGPRHYFCFSALPVSAWTWPHMLSDSRQQPRNAALHPCVCVFATLLWHFSLHSQTKHDHPYENVFITSNIFQEIYYYQVIMIWLLAWCSCAHWKQQWKRVKFEFNSCLQPVFNHFFTVWVLYLEGNKWLLTKYVISWHDNDMKNSKLVHMQIESSVSSTFSSFTYVVNYWYQWQYISGTFAPSGGGNQKPERDLRWTGEGRHYDLNLCICVYLHVCMNKDYNLYGCFSCSYVVYVYFMCSREAL